MVYDCKTGQCRYHGVVYATLRMCLESVWPAKIHMKGDVNNHAKD